jgi:hypothetical protein
MSGETRSMLSAIAWSRNCASDGGYQGSIHMPRGGARKAWTQAEVDEARRRVGAGEAADRVAIDMKRSKSYVRKVARGYTPAHLSAERRPWSVEKLAPHTRAWWGTVAPAGWPR